MPLKANFKFRLSHSLFRRASRVLRLRGISKSDFGRRGFEEFVEREELALGLVQPEPEVATAFKLQPYQFINSARELKICGLCARELGVDLSGPDREAASVCQKHTKAELRKAGK